MIRSRLARPNLDRLEDRALMDAGFRSYDGSGNNLAHPDWGSTDVRLIRKAPSDYADGLSQPAGADRLQRNSRLTPERRVQRHQRTQDEPTDAE